MVLHEVDTNLSTVWYCPYSKRTCGLIETNAIFHVQGRKHKEYKV